VLNGGDDIPFGLLPPPKLPGKLKLPLGTTFSTPPKTYAAGFESGAGSRALGCLKGRWGGGGRLFKNEQEIALASLEFPWVRGGTGAT